VDGGMVSAGSHYRESWSEPTATSAPQHQQWMDDGWIHNTFPLGSSSPNQLWWLS